MYQEDYRRYKDMVEQHLLDFIPEIDHKSITLYEAMKYSLTAGGKRIRPVLLLAACEFTGGDLRKALPYASAIEYIHTYSLIHDDLPSMDDDDLRRGKATNHKIYGEAMAILAGDGLLSTAAEVMCKNMFLSFDNSATLKKEIKAMNEILKGAGCKGMVAGQVADIESENKTCSKEMLDYIHLNKTSALIVAAIRAGAYLGNATDEQISDLTTYAEHLGLAFQITDDVLDVIGKEEETGKHSGSDVNKCTYVKVYGLEQSIEEIKTLTNKAKNAIAKYYDNAEFFNDLVDEMAKRTK